MRSWLSLAGALALAAAGVLGQTRSLSIRDVDGAIVFLDVSRGGRVLLAGADGSNPIVLAPSRGAGPDGIVVDQNFTTDGHVGGRLYWTTMGRTGADDGTIESAGLDGSNPRTLVPRGATFTPKQIKLDSDRNQIYWADREGMRIMRANRDGSNVETLVQTGRGDDARRDARNWCVGIALDPTRRQMYWTQKGAGGTGRILRANMEVPRGQTAASRTDIETLFEGLPEPIDLELDPVARLVYWTDRGDPPQGNTVNRAPVDPPRGFDPARRTDRQILFGGLKEGIGIALDRDHGRMFVTDLGGTVYRANLDGSGHDAILTGQGTLTGIAYVRETRDAIGR
jgi:hypothetical protein